MACRGLGRGYRRKGDIFPCRGVGKGDPYKNPCQLSPCSVVCWWPFVQRGPQNRKVVRLELLLSWKPSQACSNVWHHVACEEFSSSDWHLFTIVVVASDAYVIVRSWSCMCVSTYQCEPTRTFSSRNISQLSTHAAAKTLSQGQRREYQRPEVTLYLDASNVSLSLGGQNLP